MSRSRVFVFGSNTRGAHGAGAARYAVEHHGAIMGLGDGLQGNSYAVPTKDMYIKTLSLKVIEKYVIKFLQFAYEHDEMEFDVTRIGCGLAGYTDKDMAPLFVGAPKNCWFAEAWKPWLGDEANYNDFT